MELPGNFPGGGKGTYYGAFEQLFGPGRGDLNKHFQKLQMPVGLPGGGGMLKLRFDWHVNTPNVSFKSSILSLSMSSFCFVKQHLQPKAILYILSKLFS